jgi:hypothetical protein
MLSKGFNPLYTTFPLKRSYKGLTLVGNAANPSARLVKIMTAHAIRQYYNRLLHSIGLRKGRKRRHEFSVHGFRKYFKTRTEQSGMQPINIEILMGHSVGISDSYYRPTESQLVQDYIGKAVDELTIKGENLLQKQVDKLKQETKDNEYIITGKLQKKENEIEQLRQNDIVKEDALATLSDQVMKLMMEVQELKKERNVENVHSREDKINKIYSDPHNGFGKKFDPDPEIATYSKA